MEKKETMKTEEQVKECTKELYGAINKILDKHQCTLDISITLRQGSIIPNIGVIPRTTNENKQ